MQKIFAQSVATSCDKFHLTGFVQKWENRIPGLFFSRTQFLPNLYETAKKWTFSAGNVEVEIEVHLFSLIMIPVIKTGTTAQIEYNRI